MANSFVLTRPGVALYPELLDGPLHITTVNGRPYELALLFPSTKIVPPLNLIAMVNSRPCNESLHSPSNVLINRHPSFSLHIRRQLLINPHPRNSTQPRHTSFLPNKEPLLTPRHQRIPPHLLLIPLPRRHSLHITNLRFLHRLK